MTISIRHGIQGAQFLGEKLQNLPQSEWLTAAEAAAYLKTERRSLLRWVRQGKIKAYALAGTRRRIWRFRKEDLDDALFQRAGYNLSPPAVLTDKRRNLGDGRKLFMLFAIREPS